MMLSQLIKELQAIEAKHGDMPVRCRQKRYGAWDDVASLPIARGAKPLAGHEVHRGGIPVVVIQP